MNKALDRYGERHGYHKEGRLPSYSAWFRRVADFSFGLMDERALPHDTRAQSAAVMMTLATLFAGTAASLSLWIVLRVIDKAVQRARRPSYYPQERARRELLRAERRKIRRRSTQNACPTPEELVAQFAHAKDSPEEMIRFGSMLEDLECFVDNSLVYDENGRIIGRKGGIRRWLQEHCLALSCRYKTIMRYKAMAKKFRQVAGIRDPIPATALLASVSSQGLQKPTEFAKTFLADCNGTQIDVLWQLERRLNPDWIVQKATDNRTPKRTFTVKEPGRGKSRKEE